MRLIVGGTVFLAAGLVFAVQPMTGRALLPAFGGAQGVWATSLVFYQAALLAGYALADVMGRSFGPRLHLVAVVGVVAIALPQIPLVLPLGARPSVDAPAASVAVALLGSVGLLVLALTAVGPSLQRAFAATDDPGAGDPYAFFAVSNAGSLIALVGYPLVIEPALGLAGQAAAWSAGFILLVAGLAITAWVVSRRIPRDRALGAGQASPSAVPDRATPPTVGDRAPPIARWRVLRWMALAAVPAALTVTVTNVITLDLAATPLLWGAPLALYLLGYVVAFAPQGGAIVRAATFLLPIGAIVVSLVALEVVTRPLWLVLAIHLAGLALVATVLHGRLAADRPEPARLTGFYLALSIGGVAGGAAAALLAPVIFDRLTEYPVLVAAALVLGLPHAAEHRTAGRWGTLRRPAVVVATALAIAAVVAGLGTSHLAGAVLLGALAPVLLLIPGRIVFALVMGAILVASDVLSTPALLVDRSFYSLLRVVDDGAGRRGLYSGTTLQGLQRLGEGASVPIGYYRRASPIGELMTDLQRERPALRVGVVGLGIGGLAAYGRAGDQLTFYEIDPLVVRLAQDPSLFTVLAAGSGDVVVRIGDGRLLVSDEPPRSLDVVVLDAFSSNAVPVHLLTVEALTLYLERLTPEGVIAIHVSNRNVALEPVIAAAARELGVPALARDDPGDPSDPVEAPASHWVVIAGHPSVLDPLSADPAWRPAEAPAGHRAWTDDHVDLLGAIDWDR